MTIALECTTDISQKLEAVAAIATKVFSIYSEDDLLDKSRMLKYPAVGVLYEGITASFEDPSRQGLATELRVALVLVIDGKSIGNLDKKNEAAQVLDTMRDALKMKTSPSGHKWRFVSEIPVGLVENVLIYVQRWATFVPITP